MSTMPDNEKHSSKLGKRHLGGARQHISIGIALITVIPILSLYYLAFVEAREAGRAATSFIFIGLLLMALIGIGYYLLSRYPASIVRLRRQLEHMIETEVPEASSLTQRADDVSAIEDSLNLIVDRFSTQVERVEGELSRIGWLLSRDAPPAFVAPIDDTEASAQIEDEDAERVVLDALGKEVLTDIVGDFLDLVETSAVVYETNGALAFRRTISKWCTALDSSAEGQDSAHNTAANACRHCSWRYAVQPCIHSGQPLDVESPCGLRVYCSPIHAAGRIVGAVAFAYGDPPRDVATVTALAHRYGADIKELRAASETYETRPLFIISLAKNRLLVSARLIGEMVERRQAEESLRSREEELRTHRDHLEELVKERTSELTRSNEHLEKEAEERRRAETLKDEFVSTVSHELRTPLAIIKEGISLLADGIPGKLNDRQMKVLATAQGNVERLQKIINDLLDMSKIEAGKMKIERERTDVREVVNQTCTSMDSLVSKKGLALRARVPEAALQSHVDPLRITQVLTNLVHNALKFTREGSITVSAELKDADVVCYVQDTGIGIAEEDVPKLFQKFTQIGRVDGAGTKGTGLGLSIARRIVELHGGRMWVESELGAGTTFHFTLPVFDAEDALKERVDDMIADAAEGQSDLTLFLYDILFPADLSPEAEKQAFADGVRRLVDERLGVRMSDFVGARDCGQIVLLAPVSKEQIPLVCRRWQQVIQAGFGVEDGPPVKSRSAYASFPGDGTNAHELLTAAEKTLSLVP